MFVRVVVDGDTHRVVDPKYLTDPTAVFRAVQVEVATGDVVKRAWVSARHISAVALVDGDDV